MLYTGDFSMRYYVEFSQIGSQLLATHAFDRFMCNYFALTVYGWDNTQYYHAQLDNTVIC